jgi:hypothetical protein
MQQPCPNEDITGKCSVVRLASLAGGRQHIEIDLSQYQMTINQYQVGTLITSDSGPHHQEMPIGAPRQIRVRI